MLWLTLETEAITGFHGLIVLYGSLDGLRIEHSYYNRAQLSQKKKTLGPAGLLSFHI